MRVEGEKPGLQDTWTQTQHSVCVGWGWMCVPGYPPSETLKNPYCRGKGG